tara:strand:+ start:507 stop:1226 length:720 start_codon:yes stop_codon:yes gene_type:complete
VTVKKQATKPRGNSLWPISCLTYHTGKVHVLVKMDGTKVAWTSRSAPKSAEVVYAQLEHARCGDNAWMRTFQDVWAAWQVAYKRGELAEVTEHMDKSTFSVPWPTIEMHMPNINLDMGKHRSPHPITCKAATTLTHTYQTPLVRPPWSHACVLPLPCAASPLFQSVKGRMGEFMVDGDDLPGEEGEEGNHESEPVAMDEGAAGAVDEREAEPVGVPLAHCPNPSPNDSTLLFSVYPGVQ